MVNLVKNLFRLDDPADEQEIIEGIERSVNFRGAKLWILMIAVFVASLGLNTNSTAVIIGAMLISPLMGPIIGMGLGVGINDFSLLRRSWRNFIVATIFSIITATIYFLITPLSDVQSELLARTSPTIYDVLIALSGGLAGIIALSSRSQRTGNVIPGVAIATALMPPLCTVGFGIATANWAYALGAIYLFLINSIFIMFATLIGAVFIMKFKKKVYVDQKSAKRIQWLIYSIVFVTMIPAIWLTIGIVRKSYFERNVSRFVKNEIHFPKAQVLSYNTDYDEKTFKVILIGNEVDTIEIGKIRERLALYELDDVKMQIIQGSQDDAGKRLSGVVNSNELNRANAIITQQRVNIQELEDALRPYDDIKVLSPQILKETKTLFSQVASVTTACGTEASVDTTKQQTIAIVSVVSTMSAKEQQRLTEWLKQRIADNDAQIVIVPKK